MRDPTQTDGPPVPAPDEVKLAAIEAVWDNQAWRECHVAGPSGQPLSRPTSTSTRSSSRSSGRVSWCWRPTTMASGAGRCSRPPSATSSGPGASSRWASSDPSRPPRATPDHPSGRTAGGRGRGGPGGRTGSRGAGRTRHPRRWATSCGSSAPSTTTPRSSPWAATSWWRTRWSTGGRSCSGFGPGPHEAVVAILGRHPDFVADPARERYTVTFNRGGYLKRVRR